jgi:lipopolysaccharide export system permease protein
MDEWAAALDASPVQMPGLQRRRRQGRSRIIQAYAAREFLFSFCVCFVFFFAVFFVNQILLLAEDILSKRAPLREVLLLLVYAMPSVVAMSCPFASLVGGLMAAGKLSADNEILALMASGVPARKAFLPFLLLGIVFSLASFSMNDYFLPLGTIEFGKLYRKLILSTPTLELKPWSVKRYRDVAVVTGEAVGAELRNLLIFDRTTEGSSRVISAGTARLKAGGSDRDVILQLEDVWVQTTKRSETDRFEWAKSASMEYRISTREAGDEGISVGPREMASADLGKVISEKESALAARRGRRDDDLIRSRAALAESYEADIASSLPFANAAERLSPAVAAIRVLELTPIEDRTLQIYKLEYYKKFSIPFGALFFVFLAFPLGLEAKRAGRTVGFGLGLLVAVLYWAALIGGQTLGTRLGWSPFWSMWLPNALILALGLLMWIRRLRLR